MRKSFSFKAVIGLITVLSLLLMSVPAFAKPLLLSQIPNALYVLTSKDTPAPQTVTPGKAGIDVFHFNLYSRPHEGAQITKMDFQLTGTLNSGSLNDFTLYDLDLKQVIAQTVLAQNGHVIFPNLAVPLSKNKSKKFAVYVDVDVYATSGATFGLLIDSINGYGSASLNDLKLNKVKNWASNLFTAGYDYNANCVTITTNPGFSSQVLSPGKDVPVSQFVVKNNCQIDVSLSKLSVWVNFNGKFPFNTIFLRNASTKQSLTLPTSFYIAGTNGTSLGTSFDLTGQFVISEGKTVAFEIVATDLLSKNWAGASTSGTVFTFSLPSAEFVNVNNPAEKISFKSAVQGLTMTVL